MAGFITECPWCKEQILTFMPDGVHEIYTNSLLSDDEKAEKIMELIEGTELTPEIEAEIATLKDEAKKRSLPFINHYEGEPICPKCNGNMLHHIGGCQ